MFLIVKHSNTHKAVSLITATTVYLLGLIIVPSVLTAPLAHQHQMSNNIDTMMITGDINTGVSWLFIPCGNTINPNKPAPTFNKPVECKRHKVNITDMERIILAIQQAINKIQRVIHSEIFQSEAHEMVPKGSLCTIHRKNELQKSLRKKFKKINLTSHLPTIHRELQNLTYIYYRLHQINVQSSIEDPQIKNRTKLMQQTKHYINALLCEVEQAINNSCSENLIQRVSIEELKEISETRIPTTISITDLPLEDLRYLYQTEESLCEYLETVKFVKHKREHKHHNLNKKGNKIKHKKHNKQKKQQQRHKNTNNKYRKQQQHITSS